jgi:hypothetical protein
MYPLNYGLIRENVTALTILAGGIIGTMAAEAYQEENTLLRTAGGLVGGLAAVCGLNYLQQKIASGDLGRKWQREEENYLARNDATRTAMR